MNVDVASSRRRGLKQGDASEEIYNFMSPLHGGVDWNKVSPLELYEWPSRLFTEAWIETVIMVLIIEILKLIVASSRRRGLKPSRYKEILYSARVASSRRRGLKRDISPSSGLPTLSPLHGGVDWNNNDNIIVPTKACHIFTKVFMGIVQYGWGFLFQIFCSKCTIVFVLIFCIL